jgi:hypothetical protein
MSSLVDFVVFCCHSVHILSESKPLHDDSRKVSRFAPLNGYYIIIDELFFDNFLIIIYLLVVCKKNNNSFILVYFCQRSQALKKRLFAHLYSILVISCTFTKKKPTFLLFLCGFL